MPPAERDPVVVWRHGEALLAAPLAVVEEVTAVRPDGTAVSRYGALPLAAVKGLASPGGVDRAVILRQAAGAIALPATAVEGVIQSREARVEPAPPWLAGLDAGHVRALVRVDDERTAALLDVEAIRAP